ncbi:NAD(P)H-quinone oxidoreductase [Pacificimonas flava]|uniref:NAD(P)H-quinone oxidoreductase n=2 Tax=Pacificimonas TaxID=1960290 RepID=A0A219B4P7_9SPHN|nr:MULTISPECIES: NAD(P)H-quinone oxidoreductase [Pacificimonas]MBZ6377192.1 NAD(P)H-quinone oxidoreductase [Pacificimonas aurantium]OWV33086.1 NAD(P)H-quinone oxidoreductase [Pacificimonas flava]
MRAIDPQESGDADTLQLRDCPVPSPQTGEVLIRVAAAGINRPDIMQRQGAYPPPPGAPSIPGLEVSGTVVRLGEGASGLSEGDKVCALVAGGGYAEYVAAPAGSCLPVPDRVSLIDAAGLPETYFTVWSNLFERAAVKDGETVLIHGGTSGIGTTATQLCRAFGIKSITTNGSDEKCAASRRAGADHTINYKSQDFVEEVKRIAPDGVDAVLDMVGGDYLPRNIDCLGTAGRHVSIAIQRGPTAELPIWKVMQKRLILTGSTLRAREPSFKALIADALHRDVWPLFAGGDLKALTDRTFPLANAADAHRHMEAGSHVGKILLTV